MDVSEFTLCQLIKAEDHRRSDDDRAKKARRAAAFRAQADALEIEALAKRRLADEYDAAQERGEVAKKGKPVNVPGQNIKATADQIGLSRKEIHEARQIRDAEKRDPGVVRRKGPGSLRGLRSADRANSKMPASA